MKEQKKRNLSRKLKDKYRLVIYNDSSFEEVWFMKLSRLNLLAVFGTLSILVVALLFVLIAYTSIRELIPGYPDGQMRTYITNNEIALDSIEDRLRLNEQYLSSVRAILRGEDPVTLLNTPDSTVNYDNINFSKSAEDSIIRAKVEEEEKFNLSVMEKESNPTDLSGIHFFAPIRGLVTNSFNPKSNHYGTDIVSGPNEVVKATLDGTIIMANWTLETGYVIQIQHDNNVLSVYKHNSELLKKVGNKVKAGDAIAIIGNSGELTTGPHLHFEVWQNGNPLNPEEYVVF